MSERRKMLEATIALCDQWLEAQDMEVAGSSLSSVMRERRVAMLELEQLPAASGQSKRDELRARRAKREATGRKSS